MESAKVLYEYAKERYDIAEERMRGHGVPLPVWTIRHATDAYSFSLERYCGATLELNRYLLDTAFPPKVDIAFPTKEKALAAAA